MTTLTRVPDELHAGDTWEWQMVHADYPASTYTSTWYFEGPEQFSITGTAVGEAHSATFDSSGKKAGVYRWRWVVSGATRKTLDQGLVSVRPDPSVAGAADWRSHARKMLEACEAALEQRANDAQLDLLSYSLGSRSASRDPARLLEARSRYIAEVRAEDAAERVKAGLDTGRRILTRI